MDVYDDTSFPSLAVILISYAIATWILLNGLWNRVAAHLHLSELFQPLHGYLVDYILLLGGLFNYKKLTARGGKTSSAYERAILHDQQSKGKIFEFRGMKSICAVS